MKFNSHLLKLCMIVSSLNFVRLEAGVSFEAKLASQAVDQGIVEADMNWQASAEIGFGDFYLGAWGLTPLEDKGAPNFFEERYELYLGHGWAVADKVGLDLGVTRLINPSADDATEGYVGLFAELGTFSPSLYIYNDFDADQWSAEVATTVSIPLNLLPVDVSARLGAVDGDIDHRYLEVDLVYPLELSDEASLAFGLHYADNDFGRGVPDGNLFGSVSATLSF